MPTLKSVVTGQGSSWMGVWVEMSREAASSSAHLERFQVAEPAGCLSLTSLKLKNNILEEVLEMISAAFGCSRLERNPCRRW